MIPMRQYKQCNFKKINDFAVSAFKCNVNERKPNQIAISTLFSLDVCLQSSFCPQIHLNRLILIVIFNATTTAQKNRR